jgi:predicted transcriptional regulator
MKQLTKAEEEVMQVLWEKERAFVNDILGEFPEPKPAYNTVSTIIRILEKKGFVSHKAYGKTYEYFPVIKKDEYRKKFLSSFLDRYFGNSYRSLVSHLAEDKKINVKDLEEILELIKKEANDG